MPNVKIEIYRRKEMANFFPTIFFMYVYNSTFQMMSKNKKN